MFVCYRVVFGLNPPSEKLKVKSRGFTKKGEGKPPVSMKIIKYMQDIDALGKKYDGDGAKAADV